MAEQEAEQGMEEVGTAVPVVGAAIGTCSAFCC
jgi:hypothetical protein